MKILITEQQFNMLIENIIREEAFDADKYLKKKWAMEDDFLKITKNVIEKTHPKYPDTIFYVDKNDNYVYMDYNKKTKYVYIDYYKLWSFFEDKYGLNYVEIRELFKDMLMEHYNLRGVTPR